MTHTYTIPEFEDLWREVALIRKEVTELQGRPEILRATAARASTRDNVFVSQKQAAGILAISLSTLEQLIAQGDIKVRRIGKRVLIPRKQLDRLADRDLKIYWPPRKKGK